jgi:threonyl-tRNA synthetase
VLSAMERLVAHLIERYDGAFPPWLSPVQVLLLPVADQHVAHARRVTDELRAAGLRAECDPADATLGARIRRARDRRIPYLAVIGDREVASAPTAGGPADAGPHPGGSVALRLRDGRRLEAVPVPRLVGEVSRQVADRRADLGFDG